jgi:hypothetical protein
MSLTLDPTMTIPALDTSGPGPEAYVHASGDTIWVAASPTTVVGIDARSLAIQHRFTAPGDGSTEVLSTDDAVWITNYADDSIWRYDLTPSS